jgi:hypothetical protein
MNATVLRDTHVRPRSVCFAALLTLPALFALAGCYERVVDARGIGTDSVNVQKPYRSDTALDRAVFPDNSFKDNGFEGASSSSSFDRSYTSPSNPATPR